MQPSSILPFVFLFLINLCSYSQEADIVGSWLGKLSVGAVDLRLVFNISMDESGKYGATMDSPDQDVMFYLNRLTTGR